MYVGSRILGKGPEFSPVPNNPRLRVICAAEYKES